MKTYIFDLDGTLCDHSHRLHFIEGENKDWDSFFAACVDDKPIENVMEVCRALGWSGGTFDILYLTGRSESVRKQTLDWIKKHNLPSGALVMRKEGDHRPDTQAKRDLLETLITKGHIVCGVFEDRPSVCRVWREMGLTVFQMNHVEF